MSARFSCFPLILVVILLSCLCLECRGIGEGLVNGALSSSYAPPAYQMEASPMGPYQTEHYARRLNARLSDLGLELPPSAQEKVISQNQVHDLVEPIRNRISTEGQVKLIYLDQTPHGRKVHALLMKNAPAGSPNVAILSTPKRWTSLDQKIQLHTFAHIDNVHRSDLYNRLESDFNYVVLDSLARNALPNTPELQWRKLMSRPLR
ncbi:hypothetical protein PSEUBRA_003425 [Kalmanozyma brasiliensis GHG001]|uniref:Uncharacterized protein n=1 Tax=Kalmanozyma brasiliensis (strain GHG001) TaxID=1365824 RepID=V5EXL9_KALBG|nr:uncharacterized protein PSEUBRA_003425 [Kalmanozyma brasiliensis GHG001]EST07249.1 hypothetical protein PSEUBRA_003425 [Kalmanozyma brasiliensis GHG001]